MSMCRLAYGDWVDKIWGVFKRCFFTSLVAWMERSGIQESLTLDSATLYPGYGPLPLS